MPRYIPEDTATATAETVARRVLDAYSQIEADLIAETARRIARGLPDVDDLSAKLRVIRQLEDHARRLVAGIPDDLAAEVVQVAVQRGWAAAGRQLDAVDVPLATANWGATFTPTIAAVVADLQNAFDQVHLRILRFPVDAVGAYVGADIYQQVVGQTVTSGLAGRLSIEQVRRRALYRFLSEGVTGFTDRAGRNWRLGSYTEMATRSAITRAHLEGNVARYQSAGIHAVSTLVSAGACRHCGAWIGKVLSLNGAPAGDYWEMSAVSDDLIQVHVDATMEEARAAGLYHPNCACTSAPFFPGLSVPEMADHFDPVAYDNTQKQRALERGIREDRRRLAAAEHLAIDKVPSLKQSIRDTQKDLRVLTGQTGQRRKYHRENPRFTDG